MFKQKKIDGPTHQLRKKHGVHFDFEFAKEGREVKVGRMDNRLWVNKPVFFVERLVDTFETEADATAAAKEVSEDIFRNTGQRTAPFMAVYKEHGSGEDPTFRVAPVFTVSVIDGSSLHVRAGRRDERGVKIKNPDVIKLVNAEGAELSGPYTQFPDPVFRPNASLLGEAYFLGKNPPFIAENFVSTTQLKRTFSSLDEAEKVAEAFSRDLRVEEHQGHRAYSPFVVIRRTAPDAETYVVRNLIFNNRASAELETYPSSDSKGVVPQTLKFFDPLVVKLRNEDGLDILPQS